MEIHVLNTKEPEAGINQKFVTQGLKMQFTDYRANVLSYLFKTARLVRQERYDIVHVHGSSALLSLDLFAAWLGGCKIRIAHSRNTTCNHKMIDRLLRPFFYCLCNVRFACGTDAGKWLFGNRSFTIIKNGKDLKSFLYNPEIREKIRREYNWEGKTVIGHVGNFNYQKNHEFLINICNSLAQASPEYCFVFIGSGNEYLERAREQVKRLGLEDKVLFTGSIHYVSEMLQGLDIMLLPSRFEGLPNVVLEWQVAGLPSIISDVITQECKLTELVSYLPITQGSDIWVDKIKKTSVLDTQERENESTRACETMRRNGYDIEQNAALLKQRYMDLIRRGKCD